MTPYQWGMLIVAVVCFAGGCWSTVKVQRQFGGKGMQRMPKPSRAPHPDGKGWDPCGLYVMFSRADEVLYVGISNRLDLRMRQHADDKPWWPEVTRIEAVMLPDRYAALAAEYALIRYFAPPFNTAPSGSCDAWTSPRPPIVPVKVKKPLKIPRRRLRAA